MQKKRVVVTGLGMITPVGNSVKDTWASFMAGKSGIGPITTFDVSAFDSRIAGEIKDFDATPTLSPKEVKRTEKFVQYAVCAVKEAVDMSGLDMSTIDPYRVGVLIGSGIGSLGIIEQQYEVYLKKGPKKLTPFLIPSLIINMASGQVAITFGFKGPNTSVATACATGSHAIGDAYHLVQKGDVDLMVAGGTESCITHLGVGGFCALKALSTRNDDPQHASRPFDKERDGFVMAEGAGVVLLEELEHAKRRNAPIYAEIVGYGMTGDAYHMTAPRPDGEGAAKAMNIALAEAGLNPADVQYINAHGTSTQLNDKVETIAIKTVFGEYAKKVAISSTKSMTGHLLGAAGGVECIATILAITEKVMPPTVNYEVPDPECDLDYIPNTSREADVRVGMSNSLGFGGHNATIVVRKFEG